MSLTQGSMFGNFSQSSQHKSYCQHVDGHVFMTLDDGKTEIAGGKVSSARDKAFDLIVDLSDTLSVSSPLSGVGIPKGVMEKFNKSASSLNSVLCVRWRDFGAPPVAYQFWIDLAEFVRGKKVLFCCVGGHGRTGTSLAALTMASAGLDAAESVLFVRKNYCNSAVESSEQERYLSNMWAWMVKNSDPSKTKEDLKSISDSQFNLMERPKPPKPAPSPIIINSAGGDTKEDAKASAFFRRRQQKKHKHNR